MICDEIVSWASTCRGILKKSSKTCSAGRKTPRYSQNRATNYDMRQNRSLSIKGSMCIKIVPKNVLSGSKNPHVHSKLSYKLWFATKSSPGHQRDEVHWNSPRKLAQWVETQVKSKPRYKLWLATKSLAGHHVSMCIKIIPKNVLSESKNPQVQSKPSYKPWFATKSSRGYQRVEVKPK